MKKREFIFKGIIIVVLIIGLVGIIRLEEKKKASEEKLTSEEKLNYTEDIINLNPIENGVMAADLRLAFDWENTYTKEITLEEAFDYLGKDVRSKYYPEDLVEYTGERGDRIVYNNDDDKILLDTMYFSYDGGISDSEFSRRFFNIEVSKLGYQPDCIIYVNEEDMKISIINGVEMKIGHGTGSYGPYENPDGYYDFFYSEFYNEGIYYKINAESLNEEEFIEILKSLV